MVLNTVAILLSLFFLRSLTQIIYRVFFHPLSKFPGPKLAAATGWYEAYFDLFVKPGGQFMWELKRLHQIYGTSLGLLVLPVANKKT